MVDHGLLLWLQTSLQVSADGKQVPDLLEESDALGARRNLAASLQQKRLICLVSGGSTGLPRQLDDAAGASFVHHIHKTLAEGTLNSPKRDWKIRCP